jgi:hypothetical protein
LNKEEQTMMRLPVNTENLWAMRRWTNANPKGWFNDVRDAYLAMVAAKPSYRPEAPSDGFGQIDLDDDQLEDPVRLEMEAIWAARQFYDDDEKMIFETNGCTDGRLAATMYLALQAAQRCCGGISGGRIRKILELALAALPDGE